MKQGYIVAPTQPFLLDRLFKGAQARLIESIDWLDVAYGKAERIPIVTADNETSYIPAVYTKGMDYENLLPDERRGNYCFFVVDDRQSFDGAKGRLGRLYGTCSLIVWYDQRTVSNEWNKEYAKGVFLAVLSNLNTQDGHLGVTGVSERVERVFDGFTISDIDNRFLTYPFCGFRFDMEFSVKQNCSEL